MRKPRPKRPGGRDVAQRLLRAAKEFDFAAELCRSRMSFEPQVRLLIQPQMVNYAFAVELALKGLQACEYAEIDQGHDLLELFDALPQHVQGEVIGQLSPDVDFRTSLERSRHSFEVWRYAHEEGQMRALLFFLVGLAASSIVVLDNKLRT